MSDILVIQAARFGDLVQTKRLILSLCQKANVHIAVDSSLYELARLLYPQAIVHKFFFHESPGRERLASNLQSMRQLRQINFDVIYNCNFSGLTSALCRLFDKFKVHAYRPVDLAAGGIDRSDWIRLAFRMSSLRKYASLNLEDLWGNLCDTALTPALVNPPATPGGRGLGIALAGREARRSLPAALLAKFAEIIDRIANPPAIYLFGSKYEEDKAKKFLRGIKPKLLAKVINLTGKTDWAALVENMKGLDLLLTPDTGLMHLGAFLGVPVMAFFLSSAWAHETAPYGTGHVIWQIKLACSPCLESGPCGNGEECAKVFQDERFLRIFTQYLLRQPLKSSQNDNIQLWETAFDESGQILKLLYGTDKDAETRKACRLMIADFLGNNPADAYDLPVRDCEVAAGIAQPESEWMLPPYRYC